MQFGHHIQFTSINPFDDGLLEEIAAERNEKEAITLEERPDQDELETYWKRVTDDITGDPTWFSFSEDDEAA